MAGTNGIGFNGAPLNNMSAQPWNPNVMNGLNGGQINGMQGGGLGNQLPQPNAMPNIGNQTQIPGSAQRMPGGFGLSPQLLQMIASLQSRSPHFSPAPQRAQPFMPMMFNPNSPYGPNYPTQGGAGSGGSSGGGVGGGGSGGGPS